MDLPARKARSAKAVGNMGLIAAALSIGMLLFGRVTGEASIYIAPVFAMVALIAGAVGIVINRRTLSPRPQQPIFALLIGIALMAWYATVAWQISQLGSMH